MIFLGVKLAARAVRTVWHHGCARTVRRRDPWAEDVAMRDIATVARYGSVAAAYSRLGTVRAHGK